MPKKSTNIILPNVQQVKWPVEHVCAFTTNRQLESSHTQSPYGNLNLGLHVGDSAEQVQTNRLQLQSYLPSGAKIQWLEQVHGSDVALVNSVSSQPIVADAAVTHAPNIALAIMTADCLPILLSDKKGGTIAAIHGGWRPLASGIIANTLDKMLVNPSDVLAWLGPCIGTEAFEVGEEVKQQFLAISDELSFAFKPKNHSDNAGKYLCDLQGIATYLLKAKGVKHISTLADCTYSLPNKYYSYRRDKITGRMASIICAKSKI